MLTRCADGAPELAQRLTRLAERARDLASGDGFPIPVRREAEAASRSATTSPHALDDSSYDLLASESRLASFVAIAKDDVSVEHWFHLGRSLTRAAGATALLSWSGSMFEYLMPALVMPTLPVHAARPDAQGSVPRQIAYGAERGVPWGVSESAYNVRDRHHTYQYRAFGVPDLALKRGLGEDLVIAPYATVLAMMVEPRAGARESRDARARGRARPVRLP